MNELIDPLRKAAEEYVEYHHMMAWCDPLAREGLIRCFIAGHESGKRLGESAGFMRGAATERDRQQVFFAEAVNRGAQLAIDGINQRKESVQELIKLCFEPLSPNAKITILVEPK